eukprot:gene9258-1345_t
MINHEITDKELNEAKFLVFQDLDSPVSPAAKAYSNFVYGFDDEFKQKRRNILLDCEKKDLIRVCEIFSQSKTHINFCISHIGVLFNDMITTSKIYNMGEEGLEKAFVPTIKTKNPIHLDEEIVP